MYKLITKAMLDELKKQAAAVPKKRYRIELHDDHGEVQEMIICLMRGSYVRPHKHPAGKAESYHVIEGRLMAQIYNETGGTIEHIVLDSQSPIYRLQGDIYHAPVALSDFAIYHEVYPGPWSKEVDVHYAHWAREETA